MTEQQFVIGTDHFTAESSSGFLGAGIELFFGFTI